MTYEEAVKNEIDSMTGKNKAEYIEGYSITEEEYELALECVMNLDKQKGYEAYAKLEMLVEKRDGENDILADIAASFSWDSRLNKAVTEIHKHTGYYEEHKAKYPNDVEDDEEEEEV